MKNKILLTIFAGILLMGTVMAWEVGQTFTQEQIDGVDADNLTWRDLSCQPEGWHRELRILHVVYSCLTLDKIDSLYEVIRHETSFRVNIFDAGLCIILHDIPYCKDKYRQLARDDALEYVNIIKERIKGYQTVEEYEIGGWFDDWGFDD